jgi:transcriptional regulator with XRE-family HTH domain
VHHRSQSDLAQKLNTSVSVISRYERDEMIPSVDVAKKVASLLDSTVGYLLGETEETNLLKDVDMLHRLQDIRNFGEKEKEHIFFTLDALIRDVKNRKQYAM